MTFEEIKAEAKKYFGITDIEKHHETTAIRAVLFADYIARKIHIGESK